MTSILLSGCYVHESLLRCNYNDRIIVGYNKKMTKYKVINACNNKREPNIRIEYYPIKPIGDWLTAKDRKQNTNNF